MRLGGSRALGSGGGGTDGEQRWLPSRVGGMFRRPKGIWGFVWRTAGFRQDELGCDKFCSKKSESRQARRWDTHRGQTLTPGDRGKSGPSKGKRDRTESRTQSPRKVEQSWGLMG